jgi:hypothetical protein
VTTDPRLARLRAVADLARARAWSELAENRRADAALGAQIDALREQAPGTAPDPFQCAGGDWRWRRWRDGRIAGLNGERARLRAGRDALERAAALATARLQAIDRLLGNG